MRGLVDFGRIEEMLARIGGRIDHVRLTRVTPLAAPLFLEPGRMPIAGWPISACWRRRLGDSFDDAAAAQALDEVTTAHLTPLMAGRSWIWIEGNHDPGPLGLGGTHLATLCMGPLTFRHIAERDATGEVSGHYHPKARLSGRGRGITRPCFLIDGVRIVMPAYGTYTGGLHCDGPELSALMERGARAILLGTPPVEIPMPRRPT
jgi:hypothetical protein